MNDDITELISLTFFIAVLITFIFCVLIFYYIVIPCRFIIADFIRVFGLILFFVWFSLV